MKKLDKNFAMKWLYSENINLFVTVTLKKAILYPDNSNYLSLIKINEENIRQVGWLLRDRVSKAIYGTRNFKNKKIPPFLVFTESDNDGRPHLHIITVKPVCMNDDEYKDIFINIAKKLDWVYEQIDIKNIKQGDISKVISYSLKTGFDAFIPQASHIPLNV